MKTLREIARPEYEAGRDSAIVPEIEDGTDPLFIVRFWVGKEQIAVEGLVSVYGVDGNEIDFQQVDDDGEPIGYPYEAPISSEGILGSLTLRDGRVLRAQEGYLMTYGDELDSELNEVVEQSLVKIHATIGGTYGDTARQELATRQ